jgi:16S rRNA (guanine527-N7)-methyltransferase
VSSLETLLEAAGVETRLIEPLARYGMRVLEANRRFNLTGAKSADELSLHLIDSLSVVPYVREPYVDIGSGAGFPAVPLAIATGIEITLVEATLKKARFLEALLEGLDLRGAVVAERAETAGHRDDLRERFASGTARAVAGAPTVAELLLPFVATGGVAVMQRGAFNPAERTSLEDAALVLGGSLESEVELDRDRRILLVRKQAATPFRFPRRPGIPEKRPLCEPPGFA